MAAPRLVARWIAQSSSSQRQPSAVTSHLISFAAAGEMLADKSPLIPDRTSPLSLAGRALLGSLSAATFAHQRNRSLLLHGVAGAVGAVASAFAGFHIRRTVGQRLNLPDFVVGLLEDAVVLRASRSLEGAIGGR